VAVKIIIWSVGVSAWVALDEAAEFGVVITSPFAEASRGQGSRSCRDLYLHHALLCRTCGFRWLSRWIGPLFRTPRSRWWKLPRRRRRSWRRRSLWRCRRRTSCLTLRRPRCRGRSLCLRPRLRQGYRGQAFLYRGRAVLSKSARSRAPGR